MEEFERELRHTFERRLAPSGLKRRLMQKRRRRSERPQWSAFLRGRLTVALVSVVLIVLTALVGGSAFRYAEGRREGEAARQQVLTALRITNHALNHMNKQLTAHDRARQ
jgi:hypothetical protein